MLTIRSTVASVFDQSADSEWGHLRSFVELMKFFGFRKTPGFCCTDCEVVAACAGEEERTLLPRVRVLTRHISQDELRGLYEAADAFVLPSRGEGWGRPHVEAMAMALPGAQCCRASRHWQPLVP